MDRMRTEDAELSLWQGLASVGFPVSVKAGGAYRRPMERLTKGALSKSLWSLKIASGKGVGGRKNRWVS